MRGAEGGVAGEEDVDDDAEGPEVDGFGVSGLGARAGEDFAVAVLVGGGGSRGGTDGARYSSVPTALVMRVAGVKKRAEPKSVRTMRAPGELLVQRMLSG